MSKKISGFEDYILPLGIIGLGAFVLYKMGFFTSGSIIGPSGLTTNNAATTSGNASATTATAAQLAAQGVKPTISAIQAQSIVSTVYNTITNNPTDYYAVENAIALCKNLADLNLVLQYWGTRSFNTGSWISLCGQYGLDCTALDLPGTINMYSENGPYPVNTDLNSYFVAQGINYSF
jgi:hypothetical protein